MIRNLASAPWICPVCRKKLEVCGGSFVCENRHCFDIARNGYVNLLPVSGKGNHGDDRLMVRARTEFLNRGHYAPLAERLAELVCGYTEPGGLVVDAGCGEGYYTGKIADALNSMSGKPAVIAGLDISKEAAAAAAKHAGSAHLAVAGTSAMPLPDGCADVVLNIFSPLFPEEFRRVLRPGGKLIRVVPGERHLWQLKELVYDEPYENPAPQPDIPGFETVLNERLEYEITLEDSESICQLFMMTPYWYKTGEKDQRKLLEAERLTTGIEFEITVSGK